MPRSTGLIRPSAVTAAASVSTAPAPPTARLPRWTRCQSFANPSVLEYSHIGDTMIRLRSVTSRSFSGSNNRAAISPFRRRFRANRRLYDPRMLFVTTTAAARIERAEAGVARDFGLQARARGTDVLID